MSGDAVKIYFCDICSESIPLRDLELGSAITIKGKVICQKCNPQGSATKPLGAASVAPVGTFAPASSSGLVGAIAVIGLLTGAGSLLLLFSERESVKTKLSQSQEETRRGDHELAIKIEKALGELKSLAADLERAEKKLRSELQVEVEKERLSSENRTALLKERTDFLQESLRQTEALRNRFEQMEAWKGATSQNLSAIKADLENFNQEIRAVKEAAAKISTEGARVPLAGGGAQAGLPIPGWEEILKRLKDSDPSMRWNAVIDLGQTGDPRAIPHLIPLLKDQDVFVRNNAALTLGELDAKSAIGDLIETLGDTEQVVRDSAFTVLKRLTKQTIKFDPFGKKEEREKGIAAWREWWNANKAKILGS